MVGVPVIVVGGGPGGMEAARVLVLRGHRLTLFEKSDRRGGQLSGGSHRGDVDAP